MELMGSRDRIPADIAIYSEGKKFLLLIGLNVIV